MATQFRKLNQWVDDTTPIIEKWYTSSKELSQENDAGLIEERHKNFKSIQEQQNEFSPAMERLRSRAAETDPDKQIYGEKMIAKINDLTERYDHLMEQYDIVGSIIEDAYNTLMEQRNAEQRRKEEAEQKAAEAARLEKLAKERETEERIRQERELEEKREMERQQEIEKLAAKQREEDRLARERKQRERVEAEEAAKRKREEEARRAREQVNEAAVREREERKRRAEELVKSESTQDHTSSNVSCDGDICMRTNNAASSVKPGNNIRNGSTSQNAQTQSLESIGVSFGQVNTISSVDMFSQCLQCAQKMKFVCVVDWYAAWCGPCQMIAPVLENLAQQYSYILFLKVNCDQQPQLAVQHGVHSYPTFHVYVKQQKHEVFSGANVARLTQSIANASQALDESLLADAIAMSMESEAQASSSGSTNIQDSNQSQAESKHPSSHTPIATSTATSTATPTASMDIDEMLSQDSSELARALLKLREHVSQSQFTSAMKLLMKYVANIVQNPSEMKYRSIKITNVQFHKRIGSFEGGIDCLEACGFRRADQMLHMAPVGSLQSTSETNRTTIQTEAEEAFRNVVQADKLLHKVWEQLSKTFADAKQSSHALRDSVISSFQSDDIARQR